MFIVYVYMCAGAHRDQNPMPEAGFTGGYEPSIVGAENLDQVLSKSSNALNAEPSPQLPGGFSGEQLSLSAEHF